MKAFAKRCPFCNHRYLNIERTVYLSWVHCVHCGADGPHATSDEKAVIYWNGDMKHYPDALVCNRKSNHHELKEVDLD